MDLGEAVNRVLRGHWRLVVVLVLLGVIPGLAIYAVGGSRYTAEARVQMDVTPPTDPTGATAAADNARAIVTGQSHLKAAIDSTHYRHSVSSLKRKLKVQPLGSSGVVQIMVSDNDPSAAAAVANALANDLVQTRLRNNKSNPLLADLDKQIASRATAIAETNKRIDALNAQLAGLSNTPGINQSAVVAGIVEAQLNAAVQQRTGLEQEITTLQQQRSNLLGASPAQVATLIEAASPPSLPNITDIAVDIVLGCVIGLLVGIGIATLMESLWPTLIGRRALARLLDVPALGHVDKDSPVLTAMPSMLVRKLQLAAGASQVRVLQLVGAPTAAGIDALARELQLAMNAGLGASNQVRVQAFVTPRPVDELPPLSAGGVALVVVAPEVMKLIDLQPALDVIRLSRQPVLGVITYGRSGLPTAEDDFPPTPARPREGGGSREGGRSFDRVGERADATRSA